MRRASVLAAVFMAVLASSFVLGQSSEGDLEKEVAELRKKVSQLEKLVGELLGERRADPDAPSGEKDESGQSITLEPQKSASDDPNTLRVYWKEGIRMDSADRTFQFKIGGRIQNDWGFVDGSDELESSPVGRLVSGTEFRRARLYFEGLIRDRMEFKAQYDFADNPVGFKDVYMGLRKIPVLGNIRVGHFKEPFSLEELTSSKYITFMERSPVNSMAPGRNSGVMLHNNGLDQRLTWALGVFRDTAGEGTALGNGNFNTTARLTGLPWADDDTRFLHLGLGYRHSNPQNGTLRFRARPDAHLLPRFLSVTVPDVSSEDRLGLEAALVHGPFSVQGEYVNSWADSALTVDPSFSSYYVQGSFFFTGEHRRYSRSSAAFSRVRPGGSLFTGERGWGAWELAARFASLDLKEALEGGRLDTFTLGLNWYLNTNSRVMLNWVNGDREGVGDADILQMRFQVSF